MTVSESNCFIMSCFGCKRTQFQPAAAIWIQSIGFPIMVFEHKPLRGHSAEIDERMERAASKDYFEKGMDVTKTRALVYWVAAKVLK